VRLTFHVRSRSNFQKYLTVANSGKASATSSTIITGEPNEFVRQIHTRMPIILPEEHHDAWFSGAAGKEILVPYPAERIKAWPVSDRVNSPKNDDAEIIAPVELDSASRSESQPQLL
jgi:putative SOS response-associated peptidase YedK